jgi:UDP-N-acetylmuramoyl-tripeptide--D-alanyl-D-alanine ligase
MNIKELHQLFINSTGICTDTRKVKANTLFFALKGDNFNGNVYAKQAIKDGCSYAVVDEEAFVLNDHYILVDSVLKTLQDLARFHREQFDIPVIGITGSNGKTTSKELIGEVLNKKYNVLMTQGNLNNHLGVPFTLLNLTKAHDIAIIEMGANKSGDIKELVEIALPTHGIITNIGTAHIEGFGSLQGVIDTKTEMYHFIENRRGKLYINANDALLLKHLPQVDTVKYGSTESLVDGELIELTPYVNFKWSTSNFQSQLLKTNLVGEYNFVNYLAAISIGVDFGVNSDAICEAIEGYVPTNNRSQVTKTERNTLIVDCYNANPTSMKSAIDSFDMIKAKNKVLILGDMLELGHISNEEHIKVINVLIEKNLEAILVGAEFSKQESKFSTYLNTSDLLENENLSEIRERYILLKGSRGIRLERLIEKL